MAGRPAKPTALKLVEGRSPGRDSGGRVVKQAAAFTREAPEPPVELRPEAKAEWDRVTLELERLGILKTLDGPALAAYCLTWQRFVEAQRMITTEGITVTTSQGVGVAPWVRVAETTSRELRAWAREFGLTPSGEANITTGQSDQAEASNPFAG